MSPKMWGVAFPAIVEGLGADRVMAEAAEMGQSEVALCLIIYRTYRLLMPRHPQQIYALEAGLTFYPVDDSFYGDCRIQPKPTRDWAARDLFQEVVDAGIRHDLDVCGWVSCFANMRIAAEYPDTAIQNLYGARDRLFLCFNNPDVQQHVLAMFRELATRYSVSSIMADKIPQSMIELDALGGRIDPLLRLVGSLCFCEHCMAQAEKDEIDLAEAKRRALEIGEASRKIPSYVRAALVDELHGDTEIPLFLLEEPLFADVLRWRIKRMARFLENAREMLQTVRPGCKLSAALVPPVKVGHDATAPRAWLGAQTYRAFAPVVDTLHAVIHWAPEAVEYDTRRARDQVDASNPNCELCVHLPGYGQWRPGQIKELAMAALAQGADSLAFFCHDVFDDRMMAALRDLPRDL